MSSCSLHADLGETSSSGSDVDVDGGPDIGGVDVDLADLEVGDGCLPETDDDLCNRLGRACGMVTEPDNCGVERTVSCGGCSALDGACTTGVCDASTGTCIEESADDGTPCSEAASCVTGTCQSGMCEGSVDDGFCLIGGTCVADGAANPANDCEICDSAADDRGWTPVADGGTCDDGISCTDDVCTDGTCESSIAADSCLIGGTCVSAGELRPTNPCHACRPSNNPTAWSPRDDGSTCLQGVSCASGACQSGACQVTVETGCYISGVCYDDGAANPSAECERCDASASTTDWTAFNENGQCGSQGNCECKSGECRKPNGMLCP